VGLKTDLDDVEKRKILPYRDSNSDPSAVQPVASRYTDSTIPAHDLGVDGRIIKNRNLKKQPTV
jgi:hypothetical protein